jgi:hypothetical protein
MTYRKCDSPGCRNKAQFGSDVFVDENECEDVYMEFCKKHYKELLIYNGEDPEEEMIT